MKNLPLLLLLLSPFFSLAYSNNLPQCTLNPNAPSNKCENVTCSSYSECQSYVCTTFDSVCGGCNNDEFASDGRCELLQCTNDTQCNFKTCYNGQCNFL